MSDEFIFLEPETPAVAPTFVASSKATTPIDGATHPAPPPVSTGSVATIIPKPTGTVSGDLICATCAYDNNVGILPIPFPGKWNYDNYHAHTNQSGTSGLVLTEKLTAAPTATYGFSTFTSLPLSHGGVMATFRNAQLGNFGTAFLGNTLIPPSTPVSIPDVVATKNNSILVVGVAATSSIGSISDILTANGDLVKGQEHNTYTNYPYYGFTMNTTFFYETGIDAGLVTGRTFQSTSNLLEYMVVPFIVEGL